MPIRVKTVCDADQSCKRKRWVICPKCTQTLMDLEYVRGAVTVRVKCRRCGTYIKSDIVGVD